MNFPKIKCIQDWYIDYSIDGNPKKIKILSSGDIIAPSASGMYNFIILGDEHSYNYNDVIKLKQNGSFVFESNDFLSIKEIPEDSLEDEIISNWRIQLDIKTSRKKLSEIERVIREYVTPIIES